MSYLTLTKQIMQDKLTNEELIECLNIPNVPVIQHTILKLTDKKIHDEYVRIKLLEYSECMDMRFKILGLCKIGHLAIYALKKLNYVEEFQAIYKELSEEDREQILMLEKTFA